jgi:glutamyl-tRNA reductase
MPIIVCGINHKTAMLSLRERVIFPLDKLPLYLADLLAHENFREAVILSTCNRSEVYCDADAAGPLLDWFCRQHQITRAELEPSVYVYQDQQAVQHLMQVACGLDSMVLGEAQILGQIKEAFSESCAAGSVGPLFNRLFQQVFMIAKEVRTNTSIGACPVSVASTAVNLAKHAVPELHAASVLVIGAGDTVDLVLRHLKAHAVSKLFIVNRNSQSAALLAEKYAAKAYAFAKLAQVLPQVDIVITATGSTLPILNKSQVETSLSQRKGKPLKIIDIAVPRDVEAAVSELAGVSLYCIDDLKEMIQHNMRGREHAAEKAREVIQSKAIDFIAWIRSFDVVATTIRAYRKQIEAICYAEMAKSVQQLARGDDPAQVLASFAYAFTNKLLHTPSVQLRQAGVDGRFDILELARQLFAIPHTESGTV